MTERTRDVEEILRVLDHGYFITHREMTEVAKVLRSYRDRVKSIDQALRLLQLGSELDVLRAIAILKRGKE